MHVVCMTSTYANNRMTKSYSLAKEKGGDLSISSLIISYLLANLFQSISYLLNTCMLY